MIVFIIKILKLQNTQNKNIMKDLAGYFDVYICEKFAKVSKDDL